MQNANRFFWDSNWREVKTETGMAEKSSWDQENRRQKLSLVWRNRKKISQIIKDYFYFPFFLLIILCFVYSVVCGQHHRGEKGRGEIGGVYLPS